MATRVKPLRCSTIWKGKVITNSHDFSSRCQVMTRLRVDGKPVCQKCQKAAKVCETPMCECSAKDFCPKERRQRTEEIHDGMRGLAESLARCEEHRESCNECHPQLLCPEGITLEKEATEITLGLVCEAARGFSLKPMEVW